MQNSDMTRQDSPPRRPAEEETAWQACGRLFLYARSMRSGPPEEALRVILEILEEGPPDLARALEFLRGRYRLRGPGGLLPLAELLPAASPPVRRTPLASERI
ncbi:MAG: hypothetical protein LBW85_02155 [Deltaproteobacteria bacterium]|jgi:hypothetical protein|nr:hypothetical protein [Deltaproteobacteria bacterium]